jgi:hypothetical protein
MEGTSKWAVRACLSGHKCFNKILKLKSKLRCMSAVCCLALIIKNTQDFVIDNLLQTSTKMTNQTTTFRKIFCVEMVNYAPTNIRHDR